MRVFISYSSRERLDALRLKAIIEADGHKVWLDVFDIQPATKLVAELESGVRSADVICVLLSPTAVASVWVAEEIRQARLLEVQGLKLLPIILRPAELPVELQDLVAVDATRGLDDEAVRARIRRALGGQIDDGVLLDALRRGELADRAAQDAAERAFPALKARLERVMDQPLTQLECRVDQDTWPDEEQSILEIEFTVDKLFLGSAVIVLAPYVRGNTWRERPTLQESAPEDFFASLKPRADARFLWAARTVLPDKFIDCTDLGEAPLTFSFRLGGEYKGEERRATMVLLEKFELPSLRALIHNGSQIDLRMYPLNGQPRHVDPAHTDIAAEIWVPLRKNEVGIYGFRLWSSRHDRADRVLLESPTLRGCATDIEREALLSLYRYVPLRAELNSMQRQRRVAEQVHSGAPVPEEDRWAAFTMLIGKAKLERYRGNNFEAAQLVYQALRLTGEAYDVRQADYCEFFRVWSAVMMMASLLKPDSAAFYVQTAMRLAGDMAHLHPDEPDYWQAYEMAAGQRGGLEQRQVPHTEHG